jgi:hypothetical protein
MAMSFHAHALSQQHRITRLLHKLDRFLHKTKHFGTAAMDPKDAISGCRHRVWMPRSFGRELERTNRV